MRGASNADSTESSSWLIWVVDVDESGLVVRGRDRLVGFICFGSPSKSSELGSNASRESKVVDQSFSVEDTGSTGRGGGAMVWGLGRGGGAMVWGLGRGGGILGSLSISGRVDVLRTMVTVDTVRRRDGGS